MTQCLEEIEEAEKELLRELQKMKQIFAQRRADLVIKTVEITRQNRALEKYIAEETKRRETEKAQQQTKKKTALTEKTKKNKKIKGRSDPKEPKLWDW
jgi:hypothetical protein